MELSLVDVSHVMRLVREVCDRWDDPRAWREHLLRGICELIQANTASAFHAELPTENSLGRIQTLAAIAPESAMRLIEGSAAVVEERPLQEVSDSFLPAIGKLFRDFANQGTVTAARRQLVDDATHYASPNYHQFLKPVDADDLIWTLRWVDIPPRVESFIVTRPHGRASFGIREVAVMKLLHDEIALLIGVRLATEAHLCRSGLSKRLNETLSLLLKGCSEKQVAERLGLSPGTVHEYVTMLYKHFQVCSRAELLAYFIRRTPMPRSQPLGENVSL